MKRASQTNYKAFAFDYAEATTQTETIDVRLTLGQIQVLAGLAEQQRWRTRWYNDAAYDENTAQEWVNDVICRLFGACDVPVPDPMTGGQIRYEDCGLEQFDLEQQIWIPIQELLPLTAGPDCELTDGLYINAPNANPKLVIAQQDTAQTTILQQIKTADANSADFFSLMYNTAQSAGPDAVTYMPFAYNLTAGSTKQNPSDVGWAQQVVSNYRQGADQWSSMGWLYRGLIRSFQPLVVGVNKTTDAASWNLFGTVFNFNRADTSALIAQIQSGVLRMFNSSILSVYTNNVNALQQINAGGTAEIPLIMLDSTDRTIIGRTGNQVVLRGNPLVIAPVGDSNPIMRAEYTGGQRLIGFFGSTPIAKQTVDGASLASTLSNLLTKLHNYGIITKADITPEDAPVLALRQSDCHLQTTLDGENWTDVPGAEYLPLSADTGCNVVTLSNPGYLIVQRVDGEALDSNPVLRLQGQGIAGANLPIHQAFEMSTADDVIHEAARISAGWVSNHAETYKPQMTIALNDANGLRDLIGMQINTFGRTTIGFHGNTPIAKPNILTGTVEDVLQALVVALEDYGLINLAPCFPEIGDWAIEWAGDQLHGLIDTCGDAVLDGIETEVDCPNADTSTLDMEMGWNQNDDSFVVLMRATFEVVNVNPVTGTFVRLVKNPGIGSDDLMVDYSYIENGSFQVEWEGSEAFDDLGVTVVIQGTNPTGYVQLVSLRIEGTGVVPAAAGGTICG